MHNYSPREAPIVKRDKLYKSYCPKDKIEEELPKYICYVCAFGS